MSNGSPELLTLVAYLMKEGVMGGPECMYCTKGGYSSLVDLPGVLKSMGVDIEELWEKMRQEAQPSDKEALSVTGRFVNCFGVKEFLGFVNEVCSKNG